MSQLPSTSSSGRPSPLAAESDVEGAGSSSVGLPVHHFGLTRFSLYSPNSTSWQLTRNTGRSDPGQYEEYLFSDARMEPRCAIFCDVAAPLYSAMSVGRRYRHFVGHSPRLPERWLDRLRDAAERYPVLELVETDTDRIGLIQRIRSTLIADSPRQDSLVFSFRVDDDDLLATDFLDQVEAFATPEHHGYGLSFAAGYAALWENGRYVAVRGVRKPLVSIGQGVLGRWTADQRVLDLDGVGHHTRSPYQRPVLLDGRRPTFIQTRHLGQDTALRADLSDVEGSRAHVRARFDGAREVDDLEIVYERFPSMRGRVHPSEHPETGGPATDGPSSATPPVETDE